MFKKIICILLSLAMIIPIYGKQLENVNLFPALVNEKDGKVYGYIDKTGKWIVEPEYEQAYPFTDGLGIVVKNEKYGVVNHEGKMIVKPQYDSILPYEEERAIYSNKTGMGVLDRFGKKVTARTYDYISPYQEGFAVIGVTGENEKYGYMNKSAKVIVAPKYMDANPFVQGKALVKVGENAYQIIDEKGKVVSAFQYPIVYGYQEGMAIFGESFGGKQGYINEQGKIVIPAQYELAETFNEGVAIVGEGESYLGKQGLIDKEGKYIYAPEYNKIIYLGESRVGLGKAIDPNNPSKGSIYALADLKGNRLTEYIYYGMAPYDRGKTSVYDKTHTYFIDLEGKKIEGLPQVEGSGTLEEEEGIIVAHIDYETFYLQPDGQIIYKPNDLIPLDDEYSVKIEKYKPNLDYLVYYPQLINKKVSQELIKVNERLKTMSIQSGDQEEDNLPYSYNANFEVLFFKDKLFIPDLLGGTYYFGAAHPVPTRETPAINVETGEIYNLQDLFDTNTDWQARLNLLLENKAKTEPQYEELFDNVKIEVQRNQPFYVDEDNLYIYYPPYEIGPYSMGFVTFKIPYQEINQLINKEGAFWKAYHSEI